MINTITLGYFLAFVDQPAPMTRTGSGLLASCVLSGACNVSHHVTLRPDGSAFVQSTNVAYSVDLRKYYGRTVIADVDTSAATYLAFVVSDVDSLGQYIPWIDNETIVFEKEGDLLSIRSVDASPLTFCPPPWRKTHVRLFVEQGIGSVRPKLKQARDDERYLYFKRTKRDANRNTPLDIALQLSPVGN